MRLQCGHIGIGNRLTYRQQHANLGEQVISDPNPHSVAGSVSIRQALLGVFIRQDAVPVFGKRDGVPIDWDPGPLMSQDTGVTSPKSGLDPMLTVKSRLCAGIKENELRGFIGLPITGTEDSFIPPITSVELPGSFEQLEELADDFPFCGIRNNAYHRRGS
jgi:hypothetical protein